MLAGAPRFREDQGMADTPAASDSQAGPASSRWRAVVGILAILAVAGGAVTLLKPAAPDPVAQAQRALQAQDRRQAAQLLQLHVAEHPQDAAAMLLLAEALQVESPQQALDWLARITSAQPEYLEAQRRIARWTAERGPAEAVRRALVNILQHAPEDAPALLALSELEFQSGRPQEALPLLHRHALLPVDQRRCHLLLAEVLDDLGRSREMIAPLEAALKLAPNDVTARANLAYACQLNGQPDRSAAEARWCLQRQPELTVVRVVLAKALRDLGQHAAALAEVQQVLDVEPRQLTANLLSAELLLYQRQPEAAYQQLQPLVATYGDRRDLLSQLARAAQLTGRVEEAQKHQAALRRLLLAAPRESPQ